MYEKVIIIPQSLHFISEDERFELPLKQIAILLPLHVSIFFSYFLSTGGWKEFIRISRDCYGNF